jgi:hypothetical protein
MDDNQAQYHPFKNLLDVSFFSYIHDETHRKFDLMALKSTS